MSDLKFNDLPKILKWIKEPSHSEHLFIIEQTLKSVKADQFKVGTKVTFGRANGQKRMGIIEKFGRVNPDRDWETDVQND